MKIFKRALSLILCTITILSIVIPWLPVLNVKADEGDAASINNEYGFLTTIGYSDDEQFTLGGSGIIDKHPKLWGNANDLDDHDAIWFGADSKINSLYFTDGETINKECSDWNSLGSLSLYNWWDSSLSACNAFIKMISNMYADAESGAVGHKWYLDVAHTFFNDDTNWIDTLRGWGYTDKSLYNETDVTTLYSYLLRDTTGVGDSGYGIGYIGCDYNSAIDQFIYYYFYAADTEWGGDNLVIRVFKSDYFMPLSNRIHDYEDGGTSDTKKLTSFYTDKNISYRNNVLDGLATVLQKKVEANSSIYGKVFDGGSLDATDEKTITFLDRHLRYVNPYKVRMVSEYALSMHDNGDDFELDIFYANDETHDYNLTTTVTLPFEDPDYIGNGELGGLFPIDGEEDSVAYKLKYISTEIISYCAEVDADDVTGTIDSSIGKFKEGTYHRDLLTAYKDVIKEAVKNSYVQQQIANAGVLNCTSTDTFKLIQTILIFNIQCIVNEEKFDGTYKLGDSEEYLILNTSGVSDIDSKISKEYGIKYTVLDYFNTLNDYQKTVLISEYEEKVKLLTEEGFLVSKYKLTWCNSSSAPSRIITNETLPTVISPADIDAISDLVKEYSASDLQLTGMVTNIARVCNIASRYVVASGLYTNVDLENKSEGIYAIYDNRLEALVESQFIYEDELASYMAYMPSNMSLFSDNTNLYYLLMLYTEKDISTGDYNQTISTEATAWKRLVSLLYNVEYAFEVYDKSMFGKDAGFDWASLKDVLGSDEISKMNDWMEANKNASAYESTENAPDFNQDMALSVLRSVIELHDMCDFLGIEIGDWSETIDKYLQLYDDNKEFFDNLRKNNVIYQKSDIGESTSEEPLGKFFSTTDKSLSDQWSKGFSLSALYVPMETNLYDASSVEFLQDAEWISDFYYKYAFFRKVLYINTDSSAIVDEFVSSADSGTKIATLRDLLNYNRDIVLTVDDDFYNANQISDVISKLDYTNIRNEAGNNLEEDQNILDGLGQWVGELFDLSPSQILKTGDNVYYSETLANNVTQLNDDEEPDWISGIADAYVLSKEDILGNGETKESALDAYEYSVKQSYAVVSAVYRDAELYNECLRAIAADNAIFKSSSAICATPGTSSSDWRSVYNYYMLANLESQMKNDANSSLDLDAPIFCDLFGNIVTESGLVIIPAACNSTLCGEDWSPYTIGWSEYYNNGNRIEVGKYESEVYTWLLGRDYDDLINGNILDDEITKSKGGGYFEIDASGCLILRSTALTSNNLSATVVWHSLNKNSTIIKQLFFNDAYFNKAQNLYDYKIVNLIVEVLRGAPIESIDYTFEGIDGKQDISEYGIYMAYKLEELVDSLISGTNGAGGNTMVTMPNLAFVTGIEYIVLYAFKIAFAIMIVGLIISLYLDATKNSLGLKSMGKFIVTCVLVIVAVTLVPNLISWSYYKANKDLLTEESGYIMMLNYVKEYDGAEIGITNVNTPETETELYLKVGNVEMDWWEVIGEVLFGNTAQTVTELYEMQLDDNAMAHQKNVKMKSDGLYMDVQDIFNSTSIVYKPSSNFLENQIYSLTGDSTDASSTGVNDADSVASFVSPYYVILDQLIANINEYNVSRDVSAYSWSVGSNGHIMTYDIINPYLTSNEFLEDGYDILGLYHIFDAETMLPIYNYAFTDDEEARMKHSLWYPNSMSESLTLSKVDSIYDFARDYIIDNKDLLGKIPDEVFLKVFALQIAIEFNKEFGISYGNSIEIINVDSRDLMRFLVADKADIYKNSSYSFARFTYEEAGSIGVIFMALYTVVLWLTSFIKPAMMILILGLLIFNVIGRKILFQKESRCIEGYLIGCACLVMCNYAYSLMLKLTMMLVDLGIGGITTIVCAFLVQVLYVVGLIFILKIELKDWKNSGFFEFATVGGKITSKILHVQNMIAQKAMSKVNESYGDTSKSRKYTGREYDRLSISQMIERDAEREENGAYAPD